MTSDVEDVACAIASVTRISGIKPRWCGRAPARLDGPDVTVQLRAHGGEHRATVLAAEDDVLIELVEPAQGIAPGQAAVVYDGTRVVGSCTIASTTPAAAPVEALG